MAEILIPSLNPFPLESSIVSPTLYPLFAIPPGGTGARRKGCWGKGESVGENVAGATSLLLCKKGRSGGELACITHFAGGILECPTLALWGKGEMRGMGGGGATSLPPPNSPFPSNLLTNQPPPPPHPSILLLDG